MTKYLFIALAMLLIVTGCKKDSSPTTPSPTTGTIAGKVYNGTGDTAIVGAAISTNPATSSVITDATGAYSITNVSPGTYAVNVTKTGYYDGSVSVKVTAGNSTTTNVLIARVVDQTGMIKGTVTNAGGDTVIIGASITTSPATSSVTTDASGQYTISNVPVGSYTITATKSGYNSGNTAVTITTGKISSGDIKMNVIVNHAPTTPVLVSPTSGSTGQDRSLTLSWTCTDQDGDNISYDVYLDKSTTPTTKVASAITATNYTASNLDSAATYFWKVIAKDTKGAVSNASVINSFGTINLGQGLVAYYPFNGNANDESGNGNNANVYGPKLSQDRFGHSNCAYLFNGELDSIVSVGNSLLRNQTYSITCFIKSTKVILDHVDDQPIAGFLSAKNGWYSGYELHILAPQGTIRNGVAWGTGWTAVSSTGVYQGDSKWHFLAGIRKNSVLYIFIDGVLQNSQSSSDMVFNLEEKILIGIDGTSRKAFGGLIDDVRFYNRALTDKDIQALYHEGGWIGN